MSTGNAGMKHHFVAAFDPRNQGAYFADDAGNVIAQYVRQRDIDSRKASARPDVQMIQSARAHLDEHFVGFDHRVRRFSVLKHLWPAMLVKDYCFHIHSSRSPRVSKGSSLFQETSNTIH